MSDYRMREYDESQEEEPRMRTTDPGAGRKWSIAGIVLGVLALLVWPVGVVGIVLGVVGRRKGAGRIATVAIAVSVACTLISVVANVLLASLVGA